MIIAVASGKGGTGKTTVAGMLIKYLVNKGKVPVLAVDADLRRPTLHKHFGFSQTPGLTDMIVGNAADINVLTRAGIEFAVRPADIDESPRPMTQIARPFDSCCSVIIAVAVTAASSPSGITSSM